MQVGSEFFHICQEQINLLAHGLGASLAIIALAERPVKGIEAQTPSFVPIVTYPEGFSNVDPQALSMWLSEVWLTDIVSATNVSYSDQPSDSELSSQSVSHFADLDKIIANVPTHPSMDISSELLADRWRYQWSGRDQTVNNEDHAIEYRSPLTFHQERVVLPLVYQNMVVGVLVTARVDRGWSQLEQYEIERIAQTVATACVMDQRSQWLEKRLHQQTMAYSQLHDHQQELLDDILHQFRNPLTALRTFGKLLIKRLQPIDRNRTVAESIVRESDRLQDLLTQLSETVSMNIPALPSSGAPLPSPHSPNDPEAQGQWVSVPVAEVYPWGDVGENPNLNNVESTPLDSGPQTVKALTGQTIHLAPHCVMDTLAPLMVSAQAIAQERHITLYMTAAEPVPPVFVDAKALREVLTNLLDNALKYTPAGGQVSVMVGIEREVRSEETPWQGVAIADTGPGIPLEDQPHLFERHFRGIQAHSAIPGTGLGLAIAQLLMTQMQGYIEVFSPANQCPIPMGALISPRAIHRLQLHGQDDPPKTRGPDPKPEELDFSIDNIENSYRESLSITETKEIDRDSSPPQVSQSEPSNSSPASPGTVFVIWMKRALSSPASIPSSQLS